VALIVPSAPSNLTANVEKHGDVTLNWKDNANNETGFQLERSSNGTAFTIIATAPANMTNYKDRRAVQHGQTYYYRVAAKNNIGLSPYSNVVNAP
jgi:titin